MLCIPEEGSFSYILYDAMSREGVGGRDLERLLVDNGVTDISYKRISEYINGEHTPSFEKARNILRVLNEPIDDEALIHSLDCNRRMIRESRMYYTPAESENELHTSIRIKLGKLLPGNFPQENERYLRERIVELFGKERSMSDYIQWLIAKDLQENIISKEEIDEDGN